ncbi:uncharacterized protein [Rutidosis leptorrhynchoides]|uniref:uncharacterized protein n=1 Tax=Rutidosis leptorrhynchoides TaxID=125765 RepID=UPI003A98FC4A
MEAKRRLQFTPVNTVKKFKRRFNSKWRLLSENLFPLQIPSGVSSGKAMANGQVEVTNRDIVAGIKARLGKHLQGWVDELPHVLWAYRTTPKESTNKTPFSLVYGTEEVILPEVIVLNARINEFDEHENDDALRENFDTLEERRTITSIRQAEKKRKIANHFNKKVKPLDFQLNDLDIGKLGPHWEGPYKVVSINDYSAYHLEMLDGTYRQKKCLLAFVGRRTPLEEPSLIYEGVRPNYCLFGLPV